MSLKKQYLKTRPVCKVTFRVSKEAAQTAQTIYLVGEFNDWNPNATPMKSLKSGDFTTMIEFPLTSPMSYQYRYLLDQTYWQNDWDADAYEANGLGDDNSVIKLAPQ